MPFFRSWLLGMALLCGGVTASLSQEKTAADSSKPSNPGNVAGLKLFSETVRPTFEQVCLDCHGGKRTRSGFDLSTREGLLKGGDNGPAVALDKVESSRLLRMLRHAEDPGMPYKKPPLEDKLISAIAKWVESGAPYDAPLKAVAAGSSEGRGHEVLWATQPLRKVPVPGAAQKKGSAIDAFVLAKLAEKGLEPSKQADRRTLIRRLTFDLHGLPPTPEEIEAFVSDRDPRAYENLVDRLLASPRYGERWARRWLDVAHYAETHGYDKDQRRTNAWPYRDYVIKSLNDDKPYGRFAAEQLAGDVLFPDDPAGIAATGFIVAGPWDLVGQVELKEGTTDKKITRLLDRDDMVANAMSTFCSLTVHCARCHDHKFDPISQKDYYNLQAVFAGIERAERLYDPDPQIHRLRRSLTAELALQESTLVAVENQRASITNARVQKFDAELAKLDRNISGAEMVPPLNKGHQSKLAPSQFESKWVRIDLGQPFAIDQIALMPANKKQGSWAGPGYGFPRRFKIEIASEPDFTNAVLIADETAADFPNPGIAPYLADARGKIGRYVRVFATRLWRESHHTGESLIAFSEIAVISKSNNVATAGFVMTSDTYYESPVWHKMNVIDGMDSHGVIFSPSPTDGYRSESCDSKDEPKWVRFDLGRSVPIEHIVLASARFAGEPDAAGFGFPVRFRIEASNDPDFTDAEMLVDKTGVDVENPGQVPLLLPVSAKPARFVRITATRLWKEKQREKYLFALSEVQLLASGTNVARDSTVTALDSIEQGRWGAKNLVDGYNSLTALSDLSPGDGFISETVTNEDAVKWVVFDLGQEAAIDQVSLTPARPAEDYYLFGYGFPRRFRLEISNDPNFQTSSTLADFSNSDFPDPGNEKQVFPAGKKSGRFVRLQATRLWKKESNAFLLALGEFEIWSGGKNLALHIQPAVSDSIEKGRWGKRFLADGFNSQARMQGQEPAHNFTQAMELLQRQQERQAARQKVETLREAEIRASCDEESNRAFDQASDRIREIEVALGALPPRKKVFAAAADFPVDGTFRPAKEPRPIFVLARGDVNQPLEPAKPAALSCITNLHRDFPLPETAPEGARRAALARWITDPNNAITWRSIVNRVWAGHFGRGIVDTPNDFGNMGSTPTHPELLDYLATQFLAHDQSLKWLHRQIVTSATYRQASDFSEKCARIDSGNQYLWRMNRDRLDAESLRDTILSVSGKLDLTMGGASFDLFEFKDDFSPHYYYERHSPDDPASLRRTVYRSIVRSVPDPLMETLDCADSSQSVPVRNTTITALQALSLLNNPFMVRMSGHLAARLKAFSSDPRAQLNEAFRLALGRDATARELDEFLAYSSRHGLDNFCRLLFNSNEFIFVD